MNYIGRYVKYTNTVELDFGKVMLFEKQTNIKLLLTMGKVLNILYLVHAIGH